MSDDAICRIVSMFGCVRAWLTDGADGKGRAAFGWRRHHSHGAVSESLIRAEVRARPVAEPRRHGAALLDVVGAGDAARAALIVYPRHVHAELEAVAGVARLPRAGRDNRRQTETVGADVGILRAVRDAAAVGVPRQFAVGLRG